MLDDKDGFEKDTPRVLLVFHSPDWVWGAFPTRWQDRLYYHNTQAQREAEADLNGKKIWLVLAKC